VCETEDPQLSRLPWCNVLVLFEPGPSVITLWLLLLFGSPPCSDYEYTQQMMSFAYDRHLPAGTTWRDLFDMVSGGGGGSSRGFWLSAVQQRMAHVCCH
jgi:hypothetical protein